MTKWRGWTEAEITLLVREWEQSSVEDIGVKLGRSYNSVMVQASRQGLRKRRQISTKPIKSTPDFKSRRVKPYVMLHDPTPCSQRELGYVR